MGQRDRGNTSVFTRAHVDFEQYRVFLCQIDTPNKGIMTVPLASGLVEGGGGRLGNLWAGSPHLVYHS